MSAALTAYAALYSALGRAPTARELGGAMGIGTRQAGGHISALRRWGDVDSGGAPTGIDEETARAALRQSVPQVPRSPASEGTGPSPYDGIPPLSNAMLILSGRTEERRGIWRLDGRKVAPIEIIRAANAVLRGQGLAEIRYPGLSPDVIARRG